MQFTRCLLFLDDASQCVGHGRAVVTRPEEGCLVGAERSCEMGGSGRALGARPLSFPGVGPLSRERDRRGPLAVLLRRWRRHRRGDAGWGLPGPSEVVQRTVPLTEAPPGAA